MSSSGKGRLVTIFGGSGFLGRHTVRLLAKEGFRIRVAVKRPELAGHLQPLGGVGQINAMQANIGDEDSVNRAVTGSDVVMNLVGLLYQSGNQSFRRIHHRGAENVARAARECGAKSLVHVSSLGADRESSAIYARTKAFGEQAVLEEFPGAVILRPSVVFGPEDDFFNRFAAMASKAPVLPLIGFGKNKMQPVYVGDVARAILNAANGEAQNGGIYELGGPDIFSFKQILQYILKACNRHALLVWIPTPFAKWLLAPLLSLAPEPLLTVDQVRLLAYDNIVSQDAIDNQMTLQALGIQQARSIYGIVPSYLEPYRPKGQFSTLRL